jgi:hypothetical protein
VDGFYKAPVEQAVVTVSRPTGDFITSGGYLVNEASGGLYAGGFGLKTSIGLNVKYNNKLTNLQGKFNAIVRRANGQVLNIKTNATDSLALSADPSKTIDGMATFVAKANLTDITDPLSPVALGGNLQLFVSLVDNGEGASGYLDKLGFTLWDGSQLLFSSNWNGAATVEQRLVGGNVDVHSSYEGKNTIISPDPKVDVVTGFNPATDQLLIPASEFDAVFKPGPALALTPAAGGPLASNQFSLGTIAMATNNRFVYNSSSGGLFYDPDGSNNAYSATQVAQLGTGLTGMSSGNIWLI